MKKILAIVHDIHAYITDEVIYETLQKHYGQCHFEAIRFEELNIKLGDNSQLIWQTWKSQQSQYFEEIIEPAIQSDPERQVVYFGLAPIPLCMHLGYLIGDLKSVDVFQRHHKKDDYWHWEGGDISEPISKGIPNKISKAKGSAVIRFGTYTTIKSTSTQAVIENPISEVDITAKKPAPDLLKSMEEARGYADSFFMAVKAICENYPETTEINLFASVPCGLAFLMGKRVQKNAHLRIVTYQYSIDNNPVYCEAFTLQGEEEEKLMLTEDELKQITVLRDDLEKHYKESIGWFISESKQNKEKNWFLSIFPNFKKSAYTLPPWNSLPKISDKEQMRDAGFTDIPFDEKESKFFVNGTWYFPSWFLHSLLEKFQTDDLRVAVRLFWFHEGIHISKHGINSDNSEGLGRYARVLEESDYQADVYALLLEYGLNKREAHEKEAEFFEGRINILIKTLEAFDGSSVKTSMQTRRVNRYLIWYFQLARIQHGDCKTIGDVLDILSLKPHIDLKLPISMHLKDKVFYRLKGFEMIEAGIAFFYNNALTPFGYNGGQLSLDQLIEGLRNQDSGKILTVMRQALIQLDKS
ncbi:MAG: hypothetical protein ACI8ZM_004714 [Crocinitomix sp.]|jgi:hypothetical protein